MFRFIKIAAMCAMFISTSAFAHGHGGYGGHGGFGFGGYGYYRPYYGGVYVAPVTGYYPQQPYYGAVPQPYIPQPQANYYGYGQQAPMYGQYR